MDKHTHTEAIKYTVYVFYAHDHILIQDCICVIKKQLFSMLKYMN